MKKETYKEGDHRITKIRKIREVNNDMCHNFYYEVRFRVYESEKQYWKGNFVIWFDIEDVAEYFDKEKISQKDIREYAEEIAWNFLSFAPTVGVNGDRMKPFYEECRKSIDDYNNKNSRAA